MATRVSRIPEEIKRVRRMADNFRAIGSDGKWQKDLDYESVAQKAADELEQIINQTTRGLEWGEGKQEDYGQVFYSISRSKHSFTVNWIGTKIKYVEYGTGIEATGAQSYSAITGESPTFGYQARPTGHGLLDTEWFFDVPMEGTYRSSGWEPLAPYYKFVQKMKATGFKNPAYTRFRRAVRGTLKKKLLRK